MAKKTTKKSSTTATEPTAKKSKVDSAAEMIDQRIEDLGDWQRETIQKVREIIKEAIPEAVEEVKWRKPSNHMQGVPVWSLSGIICTGETYKDKVKFTFAKGAFLEDPKGIFNASLEGNMRRAIDIFEGDKIEKTALTALLREAAAFNTKNSAPNRKKSNT